MKTVIEWISDHVRLVLVGQLLALIGLCVFSAIATESFVFYLVITSCGTLLFAGSVAILLTVWLIGNVRVDDKKQDQ